VNSRCLTWLLTLWKPGAEVFSKEVRETKVVVKAEATFYAALLECSPALLSTTRGLTIEKRALGTYLVLSEAIVAPQSLFTRYLKYGHSRQVFGTEHPLYGRACVHYNDMGEPQAINHFNTRLLLAFFEVQLALGFAGPAFHRHQKAIEDILAGKQSVLETNYYNPFTHQDNVGIHYVYGPEEMGSGYGQADWGKFLRYSEWAMRRAFALSPQDFGGTEEGLMRALAQYPGGVSDAHARDGSIPMFPIRHWTKIVSHIFQNKSSANRAISFPEMVGEAVYIPFVDCLLDMPYQRDAVIVFQSVCGSK